MIGCLRHNPLNYLEDPLLFQKWSFLECLYFGTDGDPICFFFSDSFSKNLVFNQKKAEAANEWSYISNPYAFN